MKRRQMLQGLTGLGGLACAGLWSSSVLAESKNKQARAQIQSAVCEAGQPSQTAFTLYTRGVGTNILHIASSQNSLALVIPKGVRGKGRNMRLLDLDALPEVDTLIVCPLHDHYDHTANLGGLRGGLLNPGSNHAMLCGTKKVLRRKGADLYYRHEIAGAQSKLETSIPGISITLEFYRQGERGESHAPHWGAGKNCSVSNRHCGMRLPVRSVEAYALLAHFRVETADGPQEFTLFANDAASGFVAGNLPDALPVCDLALVAVADAHLAYGYPEELLEKLAPAEVRWTDWEGYFWDPMHALKTNEAPKTGGPAIMPLGAVEDLEGQGCFVRHGHVESFAGRPASGGAAVAEPEDAEPEAAPEDVEAEAAPEDVEAEPET
ncbi:hypothetical protein G6O69_06315 [Pseudenhygromyxa sp. WMMC2535]|uniref:hypothetical protein n=1 Tax=Pseudenhygromyxa sp. WMMC2535 TaxID=2712867 RepID=UPI0015554082|nr:hypothetical protein [Pseudenhygromyxa sp. WMMC2535]NVB37438.1 hypothetical protein [Pseudenhygromyxa sp. WMMC2535]